MNSRYRANIVTVRYWVNGAVIVALLVLPILHIVKFDFLNGVFYAFGEKTTWLQTATAFLFIWAGSYVFTLIANYLYGRIFCGWICSWGTLLKTLRYTTETVKQKKLAPIIPHLATLVASLIATVGLLNWFTDLSVLFSPSHSAFVPFVIVFVSLTATAYVMLWKVGLNFCQLYCPIGWYLNVTSQKHMMRIDFEPANCTLGEVCVHDCPMALDPRLLATDTEADSHGQCVLCYDCLSSCNACAAKVPGTKPLTIGISKQPVLELDLIGILKQMRLDKDEKRKAKRTAAKVNLSSPLIQLSVDDSLELHQKKGGS